MTDYKLVPVEPTAEMVQAYKAMWSPGFCDDRMAQECYAAIMAAAPAVQGEPVAWVTADTVDGQAVNGKPRRIWWENNEGVGMPIYTAPQPAEQQPCPESIREGAPYDDPAFESLCREHEIWGTPADAQCAVFWEAGKRVAEQKPAPDVAALVDAASAALDEIEKIMQEAYNSAYPVCCGRPGSECCGSPEPEWSEFDQNTLDRLAPHQRALTAALAAYRKGGDA